VTLDDVLINVIFGGEKGFGSFFTSESKYVGGRVEGMLPSDLLINSSDTGVDSFLDSIKSETAMSSETGKVLASPCDSFSEVLGTIVVMASSC